MSAVLTPVDDDFPHDRQVSQLRVPPHSIEAESSVLGSLLLSNATWDRVGDLLTDSDFYRYEHRLIYGAIGQLVNALKPADVITVYEQLERIGKGKEVGGVPYLNQLAQFVSSAANVRRYAEIVRERSILRKLVSASDDIATAAFNTMGRPVDTIVDDAMRSVLDISTDVIADEWESMESLMVKQLDRIQELADNPNAERSSEYTATGFDNLDDMLDGGLRDGQFIVIGGRPSMGKTAVSDEIGLHIAEGQGKAVAKFSMEMQNNEGAQRWLASTGRIPLHALRRPSRMAEVDWSNLTRGIDRLRNIPFFSNERGGLNINQVRAKARALHRRVGKLGLIVVDYFQLMSGVDPRQNRNTQLEEASRGLKSLAKELKCPVVALAQINRSVEKEGDAWERQIPRMGDLKDCGSLEQDADVILMMIRPTVAQKGLGDEWKPYARGELVKQRGGRTGSLDFMWEGQYTRYSAWPIEQNVPTGKAVTFSRAASKTL